MPEGSQANQVNQEVLVELAKINLVRTNSNNSSNHKFLSKEVPTCSCPK